MERLDNKRTYKCQMQERKKKTNSKVEFNLKNTSTMYRRFYNILGTKKKAVSNGV